ncbi:zinc knuckle, partial [Ostertagia ostertagi]
MFCKSSEHRAIECPTYCTVAQRRDFLLERNMCLNCGREGHWVKDCKREGCRSCGGKKHNQVLVPTKSGETDKTAGSSTVWQKTNTKSETKHAAESRKHYDAFATLGIQERTPYPRTQVRTLRKVPIPRIVTEDTDTMSAYSTHTVTHNDNERVLLLTGVGKVWNAIKREWQPVEILFDTGADQSFIKPGPYAGIRPHIQRERKDFNIYTFGSTVPTEKRCGVVRADLEDNQGEKHKLYLHTIPILTETGTETHLAAEDMSFITGNKLELSRQ